MSDFIIKIRIKINIQISKINEIIFIIAEISQLYQITKKEKWQMI